MSDRLTEIRAFVAHYTDGVELADDVDIFQTGYVNSLLAVQVVMWVERTYGVAVAPEDLDIANFRTIGHIDRFIAGKLVAVGSE